MHARYRVTSRLLAVLLSSVAVGCSSALPAKPEGVEVRGTVQLPGGSPLAGGTLLLRPVDGVYGATAQIQKDGSFVLQDPDGNKSVVPGKYLVYVLFNNPDHNALRSKVNPRYQNSEDGDSDMVVNIQQTQSDLVIRLKP